MLLHLADQFVSRGSPAMLEWLYRHAPDPLVKAVIRHRFVQTVRYAAEHSPFYKQAFRERGIQAARVRCPEDLGDFFTLPEDIISRSKDFICRPPSIVFESSGTSGKNKQVYFDQRELLEMGDVMAAGLRIMGVTPQDRIANTFDFSIWIPGLLAHYGIMAAGNFCMAFGKVDPSEVYRRMEQYRFNVIMGEPTWLIRLTELAEKNGTYPVKLLLGGAEEMPADAIPWMQRVWHGASVKMCYGSVELGGSMAFQPCNQIDGYHVDHTDFWPEILDPDDEGFGELCFTTLRRKVMPLIRYRTRDVAALPAEKCPCGLQAPRMSKLRGRRDELIVASGGNLYPLMFENILSAVPGLTHDWQIIFRLEGLREIMEIHVETLREDEENLRRGIAQQATMQYPDLMKNLALGIFEMRFIFSPPGSLRPGRKLKRMVDRRHLQPREEIGLPSPISLQKESIHEPVQG